MMLDAVPFDYASPQAPLIVVEGRIGKDGRKANVVVDTGGTAPFEVAISEAVAKSQKLALSAEIAPPTTTAVGPARQTYRTGRLERFSLGPVTLGPVDVAVVPMIDRMEGQVGRRIDAIVGQHFLRARTISIDYAARTIDLEAPAGSAADALHFTPGRDKPLILVQARVNGAGPFTLEIDTGATGTTLSPEAAKQAGVEAKGQGVLGGAGGAVSVGFGEASVSFGPTTRQLPRVVISEAMTGISKAVGTPIDGILGFDFFAGAKLTIDYPRHELWLIPAAWP
jgi:predicted aspartyl protease